MIQITIDDMRAAGKNGYVARLNGKDRQFLKAASTTGYSTSRNQVSYEISESDHGIYEISDANFGGRQKLYYLAIAPHGSEWCDSVADAERFMNPPAKSELSYPGLKAETAPALAPAQTSVDIRIAIAKQGQDRWLKVEIQSDAGFKYFLPDLKQIPGREWLAGAKCWKVPLQSALQLREIIEEHTIRTNTPKEFEITNGAKQAMGIDA